MNLSAVALSDLKTLIKVNSWFMFIIVAVFLNVNMIYSDDLLIGNLFKKQQIKYQ